MTDKNIFGAQYGMDVIVPFVSMDWTAGGSSDRYSGVGDIQLEPLILSWQFKQFDLAAGYGICHPKMPNHFPARSGSPSYRRDDGRRWSIHPMVGGRVKPHG